jgi:hypothetical protein
MKNNELKKRLSNILHIDEEFLFEVLVRFIIYFCVIYYMLKAFNVL